MKVMDILLAEFTDRLERGAEAQWTEFMECARTSVQVEGKLPSLIEEHESFSPNLSASEEQTRLEDRQARSDQLYGRLRNSRVLNAHRSMTLYLS